MKHLLSFLFVLLLVTSCSTLPPPVSPGSPETSSAFISELREQTTALYAKSSGIRCTGVWVAPRLILTAEHCVSHDIADPLLYSVPGEFVGVGETPRMLHQMTLVKSDKAHDLALFESGPFDTPSHATAKFDFKSPVPGTPVHSMGHTLGLAWSYKHGWVSATREKDLVEDTKGPWLQVSIPINKGDSGGGLFDNQGNLVGVACFIMAGVAFYITSDTVMDFISDRLQ